MTRRGWAARLVAIIAVGGFLLPAAAPLLCDLRSSYATGVAEMAGMTDMAEHEHPPAQRQVDTSTIASTCVTVASCIASQIGFSVPGITLQTRVATPATPDTPFETFFLGRLSTPPTPPPKA